MKNKFVLYQKTILFFDKDQDLVFMYIYAYHYLSYQQMLIWNLDYFVKNLAHNFWFIILDQITISALKRKVLSNLHLKLWVETSTEWKLFLFIENTWKMLLCLQSTQAEEIHVMSRWQII